LKSAVSYNGKGKGNGKGKDKGKVHPIRSHKGLERERERAV